MKSEELVCKFVGATDVYEILTERERDALIESEIEKWKATAEQHPSDEDEKMCRWELLAEFGTLEEIFMAFEWVD